MTPTIYRNGVHARERLATAEPGNHQRQHDLCLSYEGVGDALLALGRAAQAATTYSDAAAILERVVAAGGDQAVQRDLSVLYEKVGRALKRQGMFDDALARYRDSLIIRERLHAEAVDNEQWQLDLAAIHGSIGDLIEARGDASGQADINAALALQADIAEEYSRYGLALPN